MRPSDPLEMVSHAEPNTLAMDMVHRNNANAALVFEFCYRVISICKSYFGKVDEESVKNNFVLIYELIDGAHPSFLASYIQG